MALDHPWLAEDMPTRRLPRARLEERIANLLASQNMCVLATVGPEGAHATPVRYFTAGFAVVFTASPSSPKLRNMAADPRVSVGVFAPLAGPASSRGAQLFGRGRVLGPGDPDHARYWAAVRWEADHVATGRSLDDPPVETLGVVEPERIVYTEHWLRREGYAARQFWRARPDG